MDAENKQIIKSLVQKLKDNGIDFQVYDDMLFICRVGLVNDTKCKYEYGYYMDYVKEIALKEITNDKLHAELWRKLYWDAVKNKAYHFFEDYLIYMERKRSYEKRFYEPRQKTLKLIVDDLQKLEDSPTQRFYGLSMPSRVGKSTIILFFLTWIILRHPLSHNAIGSHSGILANHFYKELLDIFETEEYSFLELYEYYHPEEKFIEDRSAENMTLSFGTKGDFPSITTRGIDGSWTGVVDISSDGYLCVDDLVRDRTHSLSPKRMNDTFSEYLNKMVDRMNDGAKQLMIGTLWNVLDPLMRLEEMYKDDDRYVFRKIPALNEQGESNFNYEYKGFTTQYYVEMKDRLERAGNKAEWMAKYQQAPYVREGILLPADELSYFNGILPKNHKYRFTVNCDVAFGGGDSVSMPIGLQDLSTQIVYIVDWYFDSSGVMITVPGVVDMIMKYGIKNVIFEANAGGQLYASKIQEELNTRSYLCSCESKRAPNNASKVDKIKACEGVIRQKFRFLDGTKHNEADYGDDVMVFDRTSAYERALDEMTTFVTIGKNLHDDAIDGISQIAETVFDTMQRRTVIMDCPF